MIIEKGNVFYCDCGFSFERGRSGTHDCGTGLRKKLAESQREFRAADATIENMQMQVEKLAAENAGLKESVEHAAGCIQAAEAEGLIDALAEKDGERLADLIHRRLCHAYLPVETPATDAFLAEVRAQGVEMLTSKLQSLIDEGNFEGDEIGVIAGAVYTGADIAAQIRRGGSHEQASRRN